MGVRKPLVMIGGVVRGLPDSDFVSGGFMSAADKTKLDGIADGANNYTHPASHPPSIIAQDASNRFVTDAEKSTWNDKADGTHSHSFASITGKPTTLAGYGITDVQASIAANIHSATAKPTPVDADELGLIDSAASSALKKLTFANLKTWIASLFLPLTGGNISGSLGIGTSSPGAILHTHATSGVAHIISSSSVSPALEFRDSAATQNRWWIGSGASAPTDGALFVYDAKQAALRLTISPGGEMAALNSSGLGYGAGSGGNVTQAVNLTQAVEINKPTGTITMFSGLTAGQDVVFEVYNNKIANTDVLVLTPQTGLLQGYSFEADIPANGYFRIRAKNITSADISIVPVIGFAIIKGARA